MQKRRSTFESLELTPVEQESLEYFDRLYAQQVGGRLFSGETPTVGIQVSHLVGLVALAAVGAVGLVAAAVLSIGRLLS